MKELKSELSGKLEDVIVGLMQTPELFDVYSLNKAIAVELIYVDLSKIEFLSMQLMVIFLREWALMKRH